MYKDIFVPINKILNAEDRMLAIEQKYFLALVLDASEYVSQIQQNARILATVDCLLSFSVVAKKNNYCRPKIAETDSLEIKDGRHPVIERQLPVGEEYVPNDIYLDNESQQIIIITGPIKRLLQGNGKFVGFIDRFFNVIH